MGQHDPSRGGHRANGRTERLLTDADTGSAYEAHMRKADGSEVIVYVNSSFHVTGTGTMGHP